MSFTVRKVGVPAFEIADLGITVNGGASAERDLRDMSAYNIAESDDLAAAISGGDLLVLDPRDNSTVLSALDGEAVRATANDAHFGINGGIFSNLDAPGASLNDGDIVSFDSGSGEMIQTTQENLITDNQDTIADIIASMLVDGSDTNVSYNPAITPIITGQDETNYNGVGANGTFAGIATAGAYVIGDAITMSDGSVIVVDAIFAGSPISGDIIDFTVTTNSGNVVAGGTLTQVSVLPANGQTGFTLTPENINIQAGALAVNVDDSYLRNDGDTLDSGTLTVASGASIAIATGGSLTIVDAPTNGTDAANKAYVDAVSSGLDPKESVRYATTADVAGTYSSVGGTGGTGVFTAVDFTNGALFDGLSAGVIQVGDRILVKDQGAGSPSSLTQNGIYVVTTAGAAGVMERAADQDGSPTDEVSAGNYTFVEQGTTLANSGWVLQGDGELALNVDDIVWVQFSGAGTFTAGDGLALNGNEFVLDIDNLTTATITTADELAFNDVDDGNTTRNTTVASMISDLDIVTSAGLGTGILVKTADDTYINRSITVSGAGAFDGLAITNGDGVSGDPTVGLDINGLPALSDAISLTDRVAVYNLTSGSNEFYTVGELAGAATASDSFKTWEGAGNTTGDATLVALSSADTVNIVGGRGINLDLSTGSGSPVSNDSVTYAITKTAELDGAVPADVADSFMFFDASNGDTLETRTWTELITDLGLQTDAFSTIGGDTGTATAVGADRVDIVGETVGGITTVASEGAGSPSFDEVSIGITPIDLATGSATLALTDFIIVSDSADGATTLAQKYTFQDVIDDLGLPTGIAASTEDSLLGIDVTGSIVGLDIDGTTVSVGELDAADEFIVHNKDEGAGSPIAGKNTAMTGQQVADGTATILGITGLTFATFPAVNTPAEDQTLLGFTDSVRSKVLSVETSNYEFSDNKVKDNDWMKIGKAGNAISGYIMPLAGTVVGAAAHTKDTGGGTTWDMDLYIDGVNTAAVVALAGGSDIGDSDPTLDLPFTAGQKLRIRASQTAGGSDMKDVTVTVYVKWRVL